MCCQQPGPSAPNPMSICAEKSLGARPAWPSQLDPSAGADAQVSQAAPAHPSSLSVPPEDLVTCALQLKTLQRPPAGGRARPHSKTVENLCWPRSSPTPAQGMHRARTATAPLLAMLRPQACICASLAPPTGQAQRYMRTQPPIGPSPTQTPPQISAQKPQFMFSKKHSSTPNIPPAEASSLKAGVCLQPRTPCPSPGLAHRRHHTNFP